MHRKTANAVAEWLSADCIASLYVTYLFRRVLARQSSVDCRSEEEERKGLFILSCGYITSPRQLCDGSRLLHVEE